MSSFDAFLELEYGKLYYLDLHGQTKEEAHASLIHLFRTIDNSYKGILAVHGFHQGRVLKNYIRNEFTHKNLYKKIKLDASRTILLLDLF